MTDLMLVDWSVISAVLSHLMATLLPSMTTGLRASLSLLLSSLLWGDDSVKGSSSMGPAAWTSPLGTSTDIVVTGPCLTSSWLASRLELILTSSPRTLSVSVLGPNLRWTAWTWAVEYPSLWKKSNWASRFWGSGDGSGLLEYMHSQEVRQDFGAGRSEGRIHAEVSECMRFRQAVLGIWLHGWTDGKSVTSAFISSHSLPPNHVPPVWKHEHNIGTFISILSFSLSFLLVVNWMFVRIWTQTFRWCQIIRRIYF